MQKHGKLKASLRTDFYQTSSAYKKAAHVVFFEWAVTREKPA
jgi:hypothetical protein